ncbi:MAG TPA: HEAT repeat domain-containing protein [Candidatus Acidoferrales bacterium]
MENKDLEHLLTLYVCDELEAEERAAVEQHVAGCAACAAALAAERGVLELMASRENEEPSAVLLAQCRSELAEALDDLPAPVPVWQRWTAWMRPSRWFALRPALSAVALVLMGVIVGNVAPAMLLAPPVHDPAVAERVQGLGDRDLRNFDVSGVSLVSSGAAGMPVVSFQGRTERSIEFTGSPADVDVRHMLMFVVQNGQRFNTGVRLESIEALRVVSGDEDVRRTLCHAARNDRAVGVRLKALEVLREMSADADVRQTLLDALLRDENPGVRAEAINALRALAQSGAGVDRRMVEVLRDRMERDPSTYVRLQSAAAIRDLGPRAEY